jgi:hypothetical protein
LDKFLLLEKAITEKKGVAVEVLPVHGSDHWPIALEWDHIWKQGPTPFIYEKLWLEHQDFLPNLECWRKEKPNIFDTKMF